MTSFASQARLPDGNGDFNQLDFLVRSILGRMATVTLVEVKAASDGTVDIKPMVHQLDGAANAVPHGTIHHVPVWRAQAGPSAIILDPQLGDIGIALFAHSDISSVKASKAPAAPGSARRFAWADAIYLGGVLNGDPTQFVRFLASGGIDITGTGKITIATSGTVRLNTPMVSTSDVLAAGNGATGTFTSQDGKTITVTSGIVTRIA